MKRTVLPIAFAFLMTATLSAQTVPPLPPVTIATDPPGATIAVDGQVAALGAPEVSVPPGLHTVSVGDPNAPMWVRTWDLDPGDRVTVSFSAPGRTRGDEGRLGPMPPGLVPAPAPPPPGINSDTQATISVNPVEERSGMPQQQ